jgi:hypothetical protein
MTSSKINALFIEPMLLARTSELPEGLNWLYELKLYGYRALAVKTGGKVHFRSRSVQKERITILSGSKLLDVIGCKDMDQPCAILTCNHDTPAVGKIEERRARMKSLITDAHHNNYELGCGRCRERNFGQAPSSSRLEAQCVPDQAQCWLSV